MARVAYAAADVPGSEPEVMATEGTLVPWLPLDDPSGDSSSGNMLAGGLECCSPSLE